MGFQTPLDVRTSQLSALEEIQREELQWEEEHLRSTARIGFLKKCKVIHHQIAASAKKQETIIARNHQTLLRRIDTVINEEQRQRLQIMQNESLRLEGILRILEEGIRESIFSAAYDVQQRIKYFNKTIETILKTEGVERKALVGSERYAWLVACQKFDSLRLKLLRREIVQKVCEEKAAKHDKTRAHAQQRQAASRKNTMVAGGADGESEGGTDESTSGPEKASILTAAPPSFSDGSTITPSKRGGASYRSKGDSTVPSANSVKPRVKVSHDDDLWKRVLLTIEENEESKRANLQRDEDRGWYNLTRFVDFVSEREARYTRKDIDEDELARCRIRRLQLTQRQEQQEREELLHLEDITFLGFRRKLARLQFDESKFYETEQRRQMGHDQRLAHRYAKIRTQQTAFLERERRTIHDLLSVTKEETPIIVQQMIPDMATLSIEHSRERRQMAKSEESSRRLIQQEEATCIHLLYADMVAASSGSDANSARTKAAQARRDEQERQEYERRLLKMGSGQGKSETALRNTRNKIDLEKLVRLEQQARVRLNQEHVDFVSMMSSHVKTAGRMWALIPGVLSEETRLRHVIVFQERNVRDSYFASFKMGLGPRTRQPLPPLPSPPANFEKAKQMYASIKARSLRTNPQRGINRHLSSASSNAISPLSSSRRSTSTSSKSGPVTPCAPPPRARDMKGPTRGKYVSTDSRSGNAVENKVNGEELSDSEKTTSDRKITKTNAQQVNQNPAKHNGEMTERTTSKNQEKIVKDENPKRSLSCDGNKVAPPSTKNNDDSHGDKFIDKEIEPESKSSTRSSSRSSKGSEDGKKQLSSSSRPSSIDHSEKTDRSSSSSSSSRDRKKIKR